MTKVAEVICIRIMLLSASHFFVWYSQYNLWLWSSPMDAAAPEGGCMVTSSGLRHLGYVTWVTSSGWRYLCVCVLSQLTALV